MIKSLNTQKRNLLVVYLVKSRPNPEWRRSDKFDQVLQEITGENVRIAFCTVRHLSVDKPDGLLSTYNDNYFMVCVHVGKVDDIIISAAKIEAKKYYLSGSLLFYPSMKVIQI